MKFTKKSRPGTDVIPEIVKIVLFRILVVCVTPLCRMGLLPAYVSIPGIRLHKEVFPAALIPDPLIFVTWAYQ